MDSDLTSTSTLSRTTRPRLRRISVCSANSTSATVTSTSTRVCTKHGRKPDRTSGATLSRTLLLLPSLDSRTWTPTPHPLCSTRSTTERPLLSTRDGTASTKSGSEVWVTSMGWRSRCLTRTSSETVLLSVPSR